MTRKINVIDLDKTLIPFDSFKKLVINEILGFNIPVIIATFKRLIRISSNEDFKERLIKSIEPKRDLRYFEIYADILYERMDKNVIKLIEATSDENTTNVLLSASPDFYVSPLIQKLGWKGSGSYFDDKGRFVHLYGPGKISYLKSNFSNETFIYNFAISDSSTDDALMDLFKFKKKWILQ